jgi:hypothetical protein
MTVTKYPTAINSAFCVCRNPNCKIQYGLCHCGCRNKTTIAKYTNRPQYRIAGHPIRFIEGHGARKKRTDAAYIGGNKHRAIALTKGKITLVDLDDYEKYGSFRYYALGNKESHIYAARKLPRVNGIQGRVFLHREIMNAPSDMEVDHINGDTLDNRKRNLRICTARQNRCNRGPSIGNSSGYPGVSWDQQQRRWIAALSISGKRVFQYKTTRKRDAIRARKAAEKKYFGEYAYSSRKARK